MHFSSERKKILLNHFCCCDLFVWFHPFSDDDVDDVGNIFYSCFNVGLFSLVGTYLKYFRVPLPFLYRQVSDLPS